MFQIILRELRITSKRGSTYWVRMATAAAAFVVAFCFMIVSSLFGNMMGNIGQNMFTVLSWYVFCISLVAGLFLTSDCISEERREGTLGLLFLTNLTGFDVVMGKLFSSGLNALYGLFALLPILGLSLLVGGVTGTQFFSCSLALVNILFFGLSAGMFVSVFTRETLWSVLGSLAVMFIVLAGLSLLAILFNHFRIGTIFRMLNPFSPFNSIVSTLSGISNRAEFWESLAISNLVSWFLVFTSAFMLPRVIREKTGSFKSLELLLNKFKVTPKKKILSDGNPVLWLMERVNWSGKIAWWTILAGAALTLMILCIPGYSLAKGISSWTVTLTGLGLKVLFAFQACRLFAETRQNGALELIACTPLTDEEIIYGQWQSLKNIFLTPLAIFTLIYANLMIVIFLSQKTMMAPVIATMAKSGAGGFANLWLWILFTTQIWGPLYQVVRFPFDFFALGWMGMWLSLSLRKPHQAAGLTLLFVLVIPSVALCVPTLLTDIFFIFWARRKVLEDFRVILSEGRRRRAPVLGLQPAPPPKI